ncbi:MAG: TetR/AcrR family transcriptional regulator [Desulfobacterales bacterium]
MDKKSSSPIKTRVKPTQARAVETREKILNAAALILEESGADGLTTKKAAELAGVRIRSVYRYFPNKQSIIFTLAGRVAETEEGLLELYDHVGEKDTDWEKVLSETLELFYLAGKEIPGLRAIRAAMQASPELRAIDIQMNQKHAAALSKALGQRSMALDQEHLKTVVETVVETATCLLDRAWFELSQPGGDKRARLFAEEMKKMVKSYMATYM